MSDEPQGKPIGPADCRITKIGSDGVAVESQVPHEWRWLWVNGVWQDRIYCSTCGKEEEHMRRLHG